MPGTNKSSAVGPFNSALEVGLRSVAILVEAHPSRLDHETLTYFDYLIVHSGDAPDGPTSIHPPAPNRSHEPLVRRGLVENGLLLYVARGLIERFYGTDGIAYGATDSAPSFLDSLQAPYTNKIRQRAAWLSNTFLNRPRSELRDLFRDNLTTWGFEFAFNSIEFEDTSI